MHVSFRHRVFIIVKAETRIDGVMDSIRKYSDNFIELPEEAIGVILTHMDKVEWTRKDIVPMIQDLGIDAIICTRFAHTLILTGNGTIDV